MAALRRLAHPALHHNPPTHHTQPTTQTPQLARKLADLREAAERGDPLPLTPRQGAATATATITAATPGAAVTPLREGMSGVGPTDATPKSSGKKGLLGIAGL